MVTTRSADKRNAAAQDELVLRSKVAESPSPASSTPTGASRKRATNASSAPRSKRVRLDSSSTQNNQQNEVSNDDSTIGPKSQGSSNDNVGERPSDETASQVTTQLIPPPHSVSTPKRATDGQSFQRVVSSEELLQPQPNSQPDPGFFTPLTTGHKRFDSQEPEDDIASTEIGTNRTGTDSSAHQEYQTAEEEIVDSDEAPDVASTKIPPTKPTRGNLRGRKAKKTAKNESTTAGEVVENGSKASVGELANPVASEIPPLAGTEGPLAQSTTEPVYSEVQEPLSPLLEPGAEPQDQSAIPIAPPSITVTSTDSMATATALETPEVLSDAVAESTGQPPPPAPQTSLPSISPAASDAVLPRKTINFAPLTDSSQSLRFPATQQPTARLLPRKSSTTLSSHRRALLANRAQRSGGAFRLEASWTKKRKVFAV